MENSEILSLIILLYLKTLNWKSNENLERELLPLKTLNGNYSPETLNENYFP